MINEIINKKWFLVLSSFLISIMLFTYARELKNSSQTSSVVNVSNSQLVSNVPVIVNMDQSLYTVSGLPETVTVRLEGNSTKVLLATTNNTFRVETPDLNQLGPGQHVILFKVTGLNEGVSATVTPIESEIVIEEKISITKPVEIEVDSEALSDVYEQGNAEANPKTVQVNGSKSLIHQIDRVVARVSLTEQTKEDYTVTAKVEAIDASGSPLDVKVEPQTVEVHVPITAISKVVPIKVIQTGTATHDFQLKLSDTQVTIVGSRTVLNSISYVPLSVDISQLTKSEVRPVELSVPESVETVIPNKVDLIITVKDSEASSAVEEDIKESSTIESNQEHLESSSSSNEEEKEEKEDNKKQEQSNKK